MRRCWILCQPSVENQGVLTHFTLTWTSIPFFAPPFFFFCALHQAIAVESTPQPYLRALLFKDQYFNEEVDDGSEPAPASRAKTKTKGAAGTADESGDGTADGDGENEQEGGKASSSAEFPGAAGASSEIDNPFLRSPVLPVKMSR